jgi:hypothetical protein
MHISLLQNSFPYAIDWNRLLYYQLLVWFEAFTATNISEIYLSSTCLKQKDTIVKRIFQFHVYHVIAVGKCLPTGWLCVSTTRLLVLVLQRRGVNVAGVYRQLYGHCSEPLETMALVDRAAWARARETVHIHGGARDGARARVVWTKLTENHVSCESETLQLFLWFWRNRLLF